MNRNSEAVEGIKGQKLKITVDWFLDRCRTVLNMMGDMTVSCLIDGKKPQLQEDDQLTDGEIPTP